MSPIQRLYISKIIPSDQFVAKPVDRPYVKPETSLPPLIDSDKYLQREEEHHKLKEYINTCRSIIKEQNQIIYISKIIPSDQFVAVSTVIPYVPLEKPMPTMLDWNRECDREEEHFKLKEYIRERRALLKKNNSKSLDQSIIDVNNPDYLTQENP